MRVIMMMSDIYIISMSWKSNTKEERTTNCFCEHSKAPLRNAMVLIFLWCCFVDAICLNDRNCNADDHSNHEQSAAEQDTFAAQAKALNL